MADHTPTSPPVPLAEREAATYVGYSTDALRAWRREGRGPAYIRVGRSIRYLPPDLDAWLELHRVETRDARRRA